MTGLIYIRMAWRNVLRNKRRTFIAGIAVAVGLAALMLTDALMIGMEDNLIASATSSFMGEGQIHHEGFRETFAVESTVSGLDSVTGGLERDPEVEYFSVRTLAFAMISSPSNVSSISMVGIDPAGEQYLSHIDEALVEGAYLDGDGERQILIGTKLADLLEVGLGDRVVMTVAQAETGDLAQEMFRVSGIFFLNIKEMDQQMAFVNLGKAQQMLSLEGRAHEIAIKFHDSKVGRNEEHPFWKKYSEDGNVAQGWTVLLPSLKAAFDLAQFATLFIGLILFGVVALGIINTLFMSLYERMFEFGVLRAVGTRPLAMGRLVIFEACALAVISVILGAALGGAIITILASIGIDYSGIEYAGVTFRELLFPVLQPRQFYIFPLWVFVFTVVIAVYPASYAARLTPARAMRKSF